VSKNQSKQTQKIADHCMVYIDSNRALTYSAQSKIYTAG